MKPGSVGKHSVEKLLPLWKAKQKENSESAKNELSGVKSCKVP